MVSKIFRFGAALAALTTPALAHADDGADADGQNSAIIVLGSGLPLPPGTPAYGEVVIDHDRLKSAASNRLEDVLRDVAGFSQFRRSDSRSANPTAQGANLRSLGGNASSRTLVVLDGVPLADPFFGNIPFDAIVPDRLDAVRVTRGGGNGAFGAGAVAGTIELASATRADLPLYSASGFYGSRNATELAANFSPNLGAGYVSISGRWDRGDGYYTTPASQIVPASARAGYQSWNTSVRAVAPLGKDFEIQARVLIFRDDRTLRFTGADSHAEGQDASIRLLSRGPWQLDALAYVQARNFSNIVISSSTFRKSLSQDNTPATGLGGKIELRPPVGDDHVLRIGADIRRASGDMFETSFNANSAANPVTARRHAYGNQVTTGAFLSDDWTLGSVVLTAGGRIDRWTINEGRLASQTPAGVTTTTFFPDRSGWEGSGRGGILWHATDKIALRAAGYTGFRLPTLNELYRNFVVFPITTQANANLAPERLKGAEAGIDLTPLPGVKLGATVFINQLDNAIANVTINATTRRRQNVDAILAKGVELNAAAQYGAFSLSASYTYSDAKVKAPGQAFDRRWPSQNPQHSGSATLAWAPQGGPRLSTTIRYTGKAFEDDLNVDVLPSYWTVDGYAEVPIIKGFSIVGRAENLFDESYYTRNSGGSVDLGLPRTLWIGIKVEG